VLFNLIMGTARARLLMSTAGQYRQIARDFHFMARGLPPGENRSTLLKMAEECECTKIAKSKHSTT